MSVLNKDGLTHLWAHIVSLVSGKVDAVDGMGLSTNDYTDEDKAKLDSIEDTYAAKGRTEAITIPVSAWDNADTRPYMSYPVACSIATANNKLFVGPGYPVPAEGMLPAVISEDDYEIITAAKVSAFHQTDGYLHFIAYGTKPTIDIPVLVTEVG